MKLPNCIQRRPRFVLKAVADAATGAPRNAGTYSSLAGRSFCITYLAPGESARFLFVDEAPAAYEILRTGKVVSAAAIGDALIVNTVNSTYLFTRAGEWT